MKEHPYAKELAKLIGGKITKIIVDTNSEEGFGEPYCGFIVEKGSKKFQVIALRDPEGNGAGFMEILDTSKYKPQNEEGGA